MASNFTSQHDEASSALRAHQLRVGSFLPPYSSLESCAIDVGASQGGDQRAVDRELNPAEHGQPVSHDFLPGTFVVTRAPPSVDALGQREWETKAPQEEGAKQVRLLDTQ